MGRGAIGKQAHRLVAVQGRHPPDHLSGDFERFPTGRQDFESLAFLEQLNRQLGNDVNDVLTVVEDQERAPFSQVVR